MIKFAAYYWWMQLDHYPSFCHFQMGLKHNSNCSTCLVFLNGHCQSKTFTHLLRYSSSSELFLVCRNSHFCCLDFRPNPLASALTCVAVTAALRPFSWTCSASRSTRPSWSSSQSRHPSQERETPPRRWVLQNSEIVGPMRATSLSLAVWVSLPQEFSSIRTTTRVRGQSENG